MEFDVVMMDVLNFSDRHPCVSFTEEFHNNHEKLQKGSNAMIPCHVWDAAHLCGKPKWCA